MEKYPLLSELTEKQKNRMIYLLDKNAFRGPYIAKSIVKGELREYNHMPINAVFESFKLSAIEAISLSKEVIEDPSLDLQKTGKDLDINPFWNMDLKNEFNKLGFDYPYELEPSVAAAGGDELSEMTYIKESTDIFPEVQTLVVRFEVKNFMNGEGAHIEALTASFYKQGDITPIVRKRFPEKDGDLPTKDQIFDEMIMALKAHYLETVLSKLDFDHKLIPEFDSLNFKNSNFQVLLLEDPDFRSYSFEVDGVAVLFTINQKNEIPFIESLSAALYKEQPDGKYEGTIQKDYFLKDGPLPKRAGIYNDLTDTIRAQRIREIFKISTNDSLKENQQNRRKNRL